MEKQILSVVKFQEAFGIKTPTQPKMLSKKRTLLRQRLLEEEVKELRDAKNILEVADALCDIMYITLGSAHEYGLSDRFVMLFDEVHSSNMSKFQDGKAVFREDGKILKPEGYRQPNLQPIIDRDFSMYKNSDLAKEIAEIEAKKTSDLIKSKIKSNLNLVDKFIFWLYNKLELNLSKKVEVIYPQRVHDDITIRIYKENHCVR